VQFGPDWSERHVLTDGTAVTLRLVQPTDRDEFDRQFRRMSPDSRYRRFFTGLHELSPEMLDYLTIIDGHDHFAVLASAESLDLKEEAGAGVARFVRLPDEPDVAEAAVTVVDDYQGRGLGRVLLTALVGAAQERGVKKFRGEVLSTNEPMRRLLEAAGAVGQDSGDGTLIFDVPIDAAVEGSVVRRILSAVATSMTGWLSRLHPGARPSQSASEPRVGGQ
jgi:RimJ/RimL family protein N-acetyltransferase